MKIGTKKIVTYEVDEIRAKKFYDRIMSEKNPTVTLQQLSELQQTSVFTKLNITYNAFRDGVTATMDFKDMKVII